ncbi:unnamed protein product, partial [Mesorhabditis spiculigera]
MSLTRQAASVKTVVGRSTRAIAPLSVSPSHPANVVDSKIDYKTVDSIQKSAEQATKHGLFVSGLQVKGVNVTSRRLASTYDVSYPNFDEYRRKSTLDTKVASRDTEPERLGIQRAIKGVAFGSFGLWGAKEGVQTLLYAKSMSMATRALAAIEISMNDIPEGTTKTYEWRTRPVFVRHRTKAEIAREKAVNVAELRDPETDEVRVKRDEWSVVIGVCTHLGCAPIAGAGDFLGYYCPCHGSHYDASGRIRKGPAPRNLDVPPYVFKGDTIVVGEEEKK